MEKILLGAQSVLSFPKIFFYVQWNDLFSFESIVLLRRRSPLSSYSLVIFIRLAVTLMSTLMLSSTSTMLTTTTLTLSVPWGMAKKRQKRVFFKKRWQLLLAIITICWPGFFSKVGKNGFVFFFFFCLTLPFEENSVIAALSDKMWVEVLLLLSQVVTMGGLWKRKRLARQILVK